MLYRDEWSGREGFAHPSPSQGQHVRATPTTTMTDTAITIPAAVLAALTGPPPGWTPRPYVPPPERLRDAPGGHLGVANGQLAHAELSQTFNNRLDRAWTQKLATVRHRACGSWLGTVLNVAGHLVLGVQRPVDRAFACFEVIVRPPKLKKGATDLAAASEVLSTAICPTCNIEIDLAPARPRLRRLSPDAKKHSNIKI